MAKKERSVLVSLWSAGSCGRRQLEGILDYITSMHLPWSLRIIMDPKELTPAAIEEAGRCGTDGFIAFVNPESAAALAASEVPTVLMSFPQPALSRRRSGIVRFVNDNDQIGRMGAEHFLSLGAFASHAFVPDEQKRGWSRMRERAFRERLAEEGMPCRTFGGGDLAQWLASLPKPAAVMAPYDFRAREVLDACRAAKLRVPQEVAVLGVDDDELVCESARPTLSSIRLDQFAYGRLAAKTLDGLMASRRPPRARNETLAADRVVERESTRPVPPLAHLSRRMAAFVREHATDGIGPDDVAKAAGVSRRLADLRFRQATGTTLRRAIEDRRLEVLSRLLRETSTPIAKLSCRCGFRDALWAKYVFKRRFGTTMRQYRAAARRVND